MTDWFFTIKGKMRFVCRAKNLNLAIDLLVQKGYDPKNVTGVVTRIALTSTKRR